MKVICDIPDDVYTRLFDNGIVAPSVKDIIEISKAIRNGIVASDDVQIGFYTTVNRDGGNSDARSFGR